MKTFACALVAVAGFSVLPSAEARSSGVVVHASWRVGIPFGRFTREEWYELATGATRRRDGGGRVCARITVVNAGRITTFGCGVRRTRRLAGPRDPRLLWQSSDLLRPRRLLRLGQATLDSRTPFRVRLPVDRRNGEGPFDATHYADLDPASHLPVRFVFDVSGQSYSYELRLRRVRRDSLPRNFFSVR